MTIEQMENLYLIFDNMPYMAWMKDKYGKYLMINKRLGEFNSKKNLEMIGRTDADIFPAEIALEYRQADEAVMKAQKPQMFEHFYQSHTASMWFETYIAPIITKHGEVSAIIGVSREIPRRKRLEKELKSQKRFLKTMLDTIPDYIFYKNINGALLGCNQACIEKLYGMPEEQAVGKTISEIVTDSNLTAICFQKDMETFHTKKTVCYEEKLPLVDGGVIDVETEKTPFYDEQGNMAGLIGISRDITIRKQVEEKLQASEEKFRQLAETINEVFVIRDKEKLLYISPAYEKIFGRSSQPILENPLACLKAIHPHDREKIRALIINGGHHMQATSSEEFRIIRPDGEIRWCWVQAYPIKDQAGVTERKAITITDITDRKRMGEELRERVEQAEMELNLAARIQRKTLPQPFDGENVRIRTLFLPYNTVSGDLFNYKWFAKQTKLRGYIVDVSGHGVAMALQTATLKMLLDNELLSGEEIDEANFQFINGKMLQYLYEECFAGLLYFEFDFNTNVLKVISGGINLFLAAKSEKCELVPIYSCYLGMFDKADVQTMTMPFKPGDVYCMMTDGASDLIEQYGVKRQKGLAGYTAWLEELGQDPERSDDFSVVCLEVVKPDKEINGFLIQNNEKLQQAQEMLGEFLARKAGAEAVMLEVAVNEALNNGFRAGGEVLVKTNIVGSKLIIRVKDYGPGFDASEINAKLKKSMDEAELETEFDELLLADSGRGILMMKMLCDRVIYNAKGNEVLLMKQIG